MSKVQPPVGVRCSATIPVPEQTARLDAGPIQRAEATRIESYFLGVLVWFGHHTRRWWAYVPWPTPGLVEASTPDLLSDAIAATMGLRKGTR
ncbi:hypothetical protein [Actinomadura terrae]|uniref:hypothetical protein n=1 Tax=Actinomadura terrae TaxID=604353 RepID=UPI001FA77691|nr:hypothetical protein [Actinomadura terrae]